MMEKQLSQAIIEAVNSKRIVGAIVLVAKNGKIICETAEGYFDKEILQQQPFWRRIIIGHHLQKCKPASFAA